MTSVQSTMNQANEASSRPSQDDNNKNNHRPFQGKSSGAKRKSTSDDHNAGKKKKGTNGDPIVIDSDDVFLQANNSSNINNNNNPVVALLEEEVIDLKLRFKQVENLLKCHAESKGDNLLLNIVSSLKLSNNKMESWSNYMLEALRNNKETNHTDNRGEPRARRRSSIRSVTFEVPSQQNKQARKISRPSSAQGNINNNYVNEDMGNTVKSNITVNKPLYSTIVADNLVTNKELLSLPRQTGRPRGIQSLDKNDRISKAMENSSKALTILNFNFCKTISSRDVMLKMLDRDLMGFLRNKIAEQNDNDVVDDDFYMLNDAIDAISLIEFRGNSTSKKTIEDRNKEKFSIHTIPINIHFSGRSHRNTFEKYVRIFAKHINIMPYWHPSLLNIKDNVRNYIKKDDDDFLSLKVLNKHVIYGAKKNRQGKWYEAFVYDPIEEKYYVSSNDDQDKLISGSAKYRKAKNLNKFWAPLRKQTNDDSSMNVDIASEVNNSGR